MQHAGADGVGDAERGHSAELDDQHRHDLCRAEPDPDGLAVRPARRQPDGHDLGPGAGLHAERPRRR
ncbi:hypothetical protein, partial [Microlunatus capsulatus]|uniref:hypothetical protein n=1 Tax=Microlunatus capsulatus TaxID=99117 RepID=UPI0031E292AC